MYVYWYSPCGMNGRIAIYEHTGQLVDEITLNLAEP